MSELTVFRDHARQMAEAEHKPDCKCLADWHLALNAWAAEAGGDEMPDRPPGCVTDADRALWTRLADEVDTYLSHEPEEELFAEAAP